MGSPIRATCQQRWAEHLWQGLKKGNIYIYIYFFKNPASWRRLFSSQMKNARKKITQQGSDACTGLFRYQLCLEAFIFHLRFTISFTCSRWFMCPCLSVYIHNYILSVSSKQSCRLIYFFRVIAQFWWLKKKEDENVNIWSIRQLKIVFHLTGQESLQGNQTSLPSEQQLKSSGHLFIQPSVYLFFYFFFQDGRRF